MIRAAMLTVRPRMSPPGRKMTSPRCTPIRTLTGQSAPRVIGADGDLGLDPGRAAQRLHWVAEDDQESIPGQLDLESGVTMQLLAHDGIVNRR